MRLAPRIKSAPQGQIKSKVSENIDDTPNQKDGNQRTIDIKGSTNFTARRSFADNN